MSRRANLTITTMASSGVIWPALVLSRTATGQARAQAQVDRSSTWSNRSLPLRRLFPESLEAASAVLTAFPEQAASVHAGSGCRCGGRCFGAGGAEPDSAGAGGCGCAGRVGGCASAECARSGGGCAACACGCCSRSARCRSCCAGCRSCRASRRGCWRRAPAGSSIPEPQPAAEAANVAAPPADAVPAEPVVEVSGVAPPPDGWQSPAAAAAAPVVPTPQLNLPAVPGLPVQLSSEISMPHDLVCEGTAW